MDLFCSIGLSGFGFGLSVAALDGPGDGVSVGVVDGDFPVDVNVFVDGVVGGYGCSEGGW